MAKLSGTVYKVTCPVYTTVHVYTGQVPFVPEKNSYFYLVTLYVYIIYPLDRDETIILVQEYTSDIFTFSPGAYIREGGGGTFILTITLQGCF